MNKNSTSANVNPRRSAGIYLRLSRITIKSKKSTIQMGSVGTRGLRCGMDGGAKNDSVVVSVAVQNAVAAVVPAVGVHVAAVESALLPFLNCTVPVGPAPWLVVATVAVRVTLPPEAILVTELVTVVVVGAAAAVMVKFGGVGLRSGPPPGCGVNRSMNTDAAVVKSESGSFTVIEVAEQAVMFDRTKKLKSTTVALAPPQMIDPPLTVSEKLVVPAVVVVGLMVLITGIGFKIVKGTPFVGFGCPGSVTVTVADAPLTN